MSSSPDRAVDTLEGLSASGEEAANVNSPRGSPSPHSSPPRDDETNKDEVVTDSAEPTGTTETTVTQQEASSASLLDAEHDRLSEDSSTSDSQEGEFRSKHTSRGSSPTHEAGAVLEQLLQESESEQAMEVDLSDDQPFDKNTSKNEKQPSVSKDVDDLLDLSSSESYADARESDDNDMDINLDSADERTPRKSSSSHPTTKTGAPSFAGLLFGNIDDDGELEDKDLFDEDVYSHLKKLDSLGAINVRDVVAENDLEDDSYDTTPPPESTSSAIDTAQRDSRKSPLSLDKQLVSDLGDPDEVEPCDVPEEEEKRHQEETLAAVEREKAARAAALESDGNGLDASELAERRKVKLDTPLAAMLPTKYADVEVTELFPEFRRNKVLRFSRIFGPGKPSSQPRIWKGIRYRKRLRKRSEVSQSQSPSHSRSSSVTVAHASTSASHALKNGHLSNGHDEQLPLDQIVGSDDEDKLVKPRKLREYVKRSLGDSNENKPKVAAWRYGPARFWYDMLGVPESGEGFDYGFKLRAPSPPRPAAEELNSDGHEKASDIEIPPDDPEAYLMVNQIEWEKNVIWNGEDVKNEVLQVLQMKCHPAGWIPSGHNRTASSFTQHQQSKSSTTKSDPVPVAAQTSKDKKSKDKKKEQLLSQQSALQSTSAEPKKDKDATEWYSIFPVENQDLVYGLWEDDIIWDSEAMTKIPKPKLVTIDPNDENLILHIPDENLKPSRVGGPSTSVQPIKEKKDQARRSRMLLGKVGFIAEPDPVSPEPEEPAVKDPYNISNDEYYMSKGADHRQHKTSLGISSLIQHSLPALELRQPYFPTFLNYTRLRSFHRPVLKKYSHGLIANSLPHGVAPLVKHIKRKEKQREQERQAAGGGEIFFMRTSEDLSGKDGDLILVEYSEEHPPLLSMVGMAAVIKNYYKRKVGKDPGPPEYKYGETVHVHQSPFLGTLSPGHSQQSLESQLFKAPIYHHDVPDTDFLVIRTRDSYSIREVSSLFVVGQELPITEVPGPNSKKANNFIRDFLQVFVYRLFSKNRDVPKRIKMEDIKKAFPTHSESSIRKRLKLCADFKRTGQGSDSNWWVLKQDFRLPTEDEIRALVTPEQVCAYYSMEAAQQRLADAGYGEKSFLGAEDDNDEDIQMKMDDEVKTAPWNTTRAYIAARRGKCLLQLTGVADPTGVGEGFSYVRVPNKPQMNKDEQAREPQPKKTVTGTDADLRRLPLNQARQVLRNFGVPEDQIKKLTRWEVIDVVRTLSTEQAKAGDQDSMSKFARGNRFSIAEHQERYKEECQRIFDLQNKVLSSNEVLSTDESESDDDEEGELSDIEEMGKDIESMLNSKKTSEQISFEKEEAERRELRRLFVDEDSNQGPGKRKNADKRDTGEEDDMIPTTSQTTSQNRILKIFRTYQGDNGKEFVRIETIRKPAVIDTYVKIRETKTHEFIHRFATSLDDETREGLRKDQRKLKEQLRRIDRQKKKSKLHEAYGMSGLMSPSKSSLGDSSLTETGRKKREKKEKPVKVSKVNCSACGGVGHMRSNRICPAFTGLRLGEESSSYVPPIQVAMTDEQLRTDELSQMNNDELVKVDDTKIVLSKHLFTQMDEMKRKSLVLKVPKEALRAQKRRRIGTSEHCDYLEKKKSTNRRRTDPLVTLATILEDLINEMREVPDASWFYNPVNPKQVPDYANIIKEPMDLLTMRQKCRDKIYKNRKEFMKDCDLIVNNSGLYNGALSPITQTAKNMLQLAERKLAEKDEKLSRLEKAINPLLDDDDQVAFSYILETIVEKLKAIPDTRPFQLPVDRKKVKNYYEVIENPVDLQTIETRAKEHFYHTRDEFLAQLALMRKNSVKFNGAESKFTEKAAEIEAVAEQLIAEQADQITVLEDKIALARETALNALEAGETDGSVTTSRDGETSTRIGSASRPPSSAGNVSDVFEDEENEDHDSDDDDDDDEQEENTRDYAGDAGHSTQTVSQGGGGGGGPGDAEMFDENYDPAQFLIESLNRAPSNGAVPPPPVEEDANHATMQAQHAECHETAASPDAHQNDDDEDDEEPRMEIQEEESPAPPTETNVDKQGGAEAEGEADEDEGDLWF